MAAPTKKGRKNKRSSFLCSFGACFGFSTKVSADHDDGKPRRPSLPVNDRHTPTAAAEAEAEIVASSREIHVVEDDEEKRISPSADGFVTNKSDDDKTWEKSKKREEFSPITKRGEKLNSTAHDTWKNHRKLSHSVSLPLPHQKREKPAAVGGEKKREKPAAVGGEIDSMFGAVIIMVTLVVMVIWGKICAILCTAAWLYFVPRYRANLDRSYAIKFKNGGTDRLDFDSREYKKRVVLQGLLHRNQNT